MADIVIETLGNNDNYRAMSVASVWTTSAIGYHFYISSIVDLHYKKSSDSGATWATRVDVKAGTLSCGCVWYNRWTPGLSGTKIHCAYLDSNVDDVLYRELETATDVQGTEVQVVNGASYNLAASTWDLRCIAVSVARGGRIGILWSGDGGTELGLHTSDDGSTFSSRATFTNQGTSWFLFLPANTSDTQDMLAISYTPSTTTVNAWVFDDSANTWGVTVVDAAVVLTTDYFQMAASILHSDNAVFLVYWNLTDSALADLKCVELNASAVGANGTTITTRTDVITNTSEDSQCCMTINQNTGRIYVGYLGGSTWATDAHVYYKYSDDRGVTWSAQQGPVDATLDDMRAVWSTLSVKNGDSGRFQPVFHNIDLDDVTTNADNSVAITPSVVLSPSVSDAVTVVESVTLKIPLSTITSDSVTVTESATLGIPLYPVVSDAVTVAEVVALKIPLYPVASDTVTVAESVTMYMSLYVQTYDDVTVAEFIDVDRGNFIVIDVADAVSVAEAVDLKIPLYPVVFDDVALAEDVTLKIPLYVQANDAVTVAEVVAVAFGSSLAINVSDALTVAESVTVFFPQFVIAASDTVTVADVVTTSIPYLPVSTFEALTVTESVTFSTFGGLLISVFDSVSIVESVAGGLPGLALTAQGPRVRGTRWPPVTGTKWPTVRGQRWPTIR